MEYMATINFGENQLAIGVGASEAEAAANALAAHGEPKHLRHEIEIYEMGEARGVLYGCGREGRPYRGVLAGVSTEGEPYSIQWNGVRWVGVQAPPATCHPGWHG